MNRQLIGSLDCVRVVGRGFVMGSIVVYLQSTLVFDSLYDSMFNTKEIRECVMMIIAQSSGYLMLFR